MWYWINTNLYWIAPTVSSVILTIFIIRVYYKQKYLQEQSLKISEEQKEIQNQNIKLALFEKRYNIYLKIKNSLLEFITPDRDVMMKAFREFGELRDEVYYLFGEDIATYYLKIINTAGKLNANLENPEAEEFKFSHQWLLDQFEKKEIRERFEKYLHLREYGLPE